MNLTTLKYDDEDEASEWHQNILRERLEKYNAGLIKLISWEEMEKKMDDEDNHSLLILPNPIY